ncbi:hypothetical protein [Novosphingobium album (ex Hu et al. 2023)]|uniref:DUF4345 domain-containing protein n=1 Tax=Novosphingobium album (ex Hu et al. 2023) TaxID=2930093 RepID=A0ABT0B1F9_9SPHN|nr:hypothetical protein [Novosphingobium album (ex Hu et al. 2023)]MCJ2178619.1 hypothetical protein [Novosphingobium album (ex Hu et al. 2023)]
MAFYDIDLTTRAGATGAAKQGGLACFVFAGMGALGVALLGGIAGYTTPEGIGFMFGGGLEAVVGVIAGLRLRAGKGVFWGGYAALLLTAETIGKAVSLSIGGFILSVVVLVIMVNGIRGALALKRGVLFEDDEAEVFC